MAYNKVAKPTDPGYNKITAPSRVINSGFDFAVFDTATFDAPDTYGVPASDGYTKINKPT